MVNVLAAVVPAASLFAQAFTGSWNCSATIPAAPGHAAHVVASNWVIAPGADTKNWTIVRWGPHGETGGTAYVGYVPRRHEWIYDDFHGDGSYAHSTSKGPQHGTWAWFGTYDTASGAQSFGPITWSLRKGRLERHYARTVNGRILRLGRDSCVKE